jgi:hypothetical protein
MPEGSMRASKVIYLAHKIHDLVDKGWEYPEAEWEVVKNLNHSPSSNELMQAYHDVEEDR